MAVEQILSNDDKLMNQSVSGEVKGSKTLNTSPLADVEFHQPNTNSEETKTEDVEETLPPVPYRKLFRFSHTKDRILVFVGILTAIIGGLMLPTMIILFGRLTGAFVCQGMLDAVHNVINNIVGSTPNFLNSTERPTLPSWFPGCLVINATQADGTIIPAECKDYTGENFDREIHIFGGGVAVLGVGQLLFGYIMVTTLNAAADYQVHRIRSKFLHSTLRQDIAWFDFHKAGEFATRTADDLSKLQEGIGEKLGIFIMFLTTFLACVVSAFLHGWELTLVMFSVAPVIVIIVAIITKAQSSMHDREIKAYSKAGNIAEEVISAIRTVVAFSGEKIEIDRYDENLISARNAGIKRGFLSSIGGAVMWFVIYAGYALAFWYGVKLILEDRCDPDPQYDPSILIIVFFSVLTGTMNIGQSSPFIDAFGTARSAAAVIFAVIDRIPPIDSESEEGVKPSEIVGNIEFDGVEFNYPSRAEVKILDGLSLKISRGETVALVGESGCGKSTTVQLLQRFYDPLSGLVKVDGIDIKTMNIGYLRDHIGVVGQEPVLFGTTIAENIRYGKEGVQMDIIERAAKEANAHDFIIKLPKKYDTVVGERGAQLSGGQKQRIAIARALVKNPKILLLDEATSALDSESELAVQHALEKAAEGRTTIIIAHRLSTVQNADKIVTISKGRVVETGTHDELMALRGAYFQLVTLQIRKKSVHNETMTSPKSPRTKANLEVEDTDMNDNFEEHMLNMVPVIGGVGSFRRSQRSQRSLRERSKPTTADISSTEFIEQEPQENMKPSSMRLMKVMAPEWPFVVFGILGSIGMGLTIVGYAIVIGEVLGVLSLNDPEEATRQSRHYAIAFVVIGSATAISCFLQTFMFSMAGERLTLRLRKESLAAMLRMEMGWFDSPLNSVGALCSRLASDASSVQGATGSRLGTILQSIFTIGAASILSLILEWRLALIGIPFVPLVLAAAFLQAKILLGQTVAEMKSLEKANKIAIEAISNIRTVASLHRERTFHDLYMAELIAPHKSSVRRSHARGVVFGFSQSVPFFAYSACLFYGGKLIREDGVSYEDVFKIVQLLIMGALMVGQAMAFAPNVNKGMISSARIFNLLDRKSLIDSCSPDGIKLQDNVSGAVKFSRVHFNYPSRPGVKVLSGLELEIHKGKVVALVGGSGCGKSTCIQLLERFYDPLEGEIVLDSHDIRNVNIQSLRAQIGIVSQEPVLFDRSIAENIAYGDNFRDVGLDEIIEAARKANIHNFISALPDGYKTRVGDKGTQLSGGQKQRIAIARALIRNPKILLLDEATSALDTESEKVVQEALEAAQKGRTCITVAHRLSTIKNADQIAVIHQGNVVEIGTHDELVARNGHYYKFYITQTRR